MRTAHGHRRVRFAPSPTGALHLGGIRTALFNWLVARASGGVFVVRIEDTDQGRHVPGSEAQILDSLRWLGLTWDEGPDTGGPHAPYVQSLRTARYRDVGEELAARGAAYWCDCTPARLEALRAEMQRERRPPRYDRRCLGRQEEVAASRAAGTPVVLRERIPEGEAVWDDAIRGEVRFDYAEIDDQVLLKGDGFPTYHLANVVDDHDMEISDVIRAEEWIPSTPKHLALYAALEWEPPRFAHVPLVLGPDRNKLSKRRGAPDVLAYRDQGYLPAAVVNAMALLGWSSPDGEEVLTPDEIAARFSLDRVQASPAVYDAKRLDALNGQHIRRLTPEALAGALGPWLPGVDRERLLELVPLLQERLPRLDVAEALAAPLLGDPPWPEGIAWPPDRVDAATAAALLDATAAEVEGGALADVDALRARLGALLEEHGVKPRFGFVVLYVAVLRTAQGVPVFPAMGVIGASAAVARLREARDRLPA
ncbi:MAG TPA: glutamate--tRNA ligase [Candidatus Dormibacteraeota bacterium]|nr:glutamate--tRNA ligase [Candidatus Dormibacteraeota bacterium]